MAQWSELILLFFIYSFIGWLWETVYCSLKEGRFVYRGFLTGPYCPIYGFGILGVLYLLAPFENRLIELYVLSAVLVTVLEYITSYLLERLFHASWWDYKDVPLNINGRVALPISAFWGVGCVLIVKIIHPRVMVLADFLLVTFRWYLPMLLIGLMLADLIYTVTNMQAFKKITTEVSTQMERRSKELSAEFAEKGDEVADEWEALKQRISKGLEERGADYQAYFTELKKSSALNKHLQRLNYNQRRWIKNYPKMKLKGLEHPESVKELIASFKKKM